MPGQTHLSVLASRAANRSILAVVDATVCFGNFVSTCLLYYNNLECTGLMR